MEKQVYTYLMAATKTPAELYKEGFVLVKIGKTQSPASRVKELNRSEYGDLKLIIQGLREGDHESFYHQKLEAYWVPWRTCSELFSIPQTFVDFLMKDFSQPNQKTLTSGNRTACYSLTAETIELIDEMAIKGGRTKGAVLERAVKFYYESENFIK